MKILMVCLGNICRSPMAEGILQRMADDAGLGWEVASAGTSDWHAGETPDRRAILTCKRKGIDISQQRSRQLRASDLHEYDLILTMDSSNLRDTLDVLGLSSESDRVKPLISYARHPVDQVPDPYFDGRFEEVFELLKVVCADLVEHYTSRS